MSGRANRYGNWEGDTAMTLTWRWFPLLAVLAVVAACAPSAPPAAPATGRTDGGVAPTSAAPQRTLTLISRGELPSLAAKPLVGFSGSLNPPVRIFNAMLEA